MTLIDDLEKIDVSTIATARGNITLAVTSPDLRAIVEGGAPQTALAGLGGALADLQETIEHPEQLLEPLGDAASTLADAVGLEGLDLDEYVETVREGAEAVRDLLGGVAGDPVAWAEMLGLSVGDALDELARTAGAYGRVGLAELGRFRALVESVEAGIPADPQRIAELALEALLPFSGDGLLQMRARVDALLTGAASISLPAGRTHGLLLALDAVSAAAEAGDPEAVAQALARLDAARRSTVASLENDLRHVYELIGRLRVGEALDAVTEATGALGAAERGILEFLELLRADVADARRGVEQLDLAVVRPVLGDFLAGVEERAHELVDPVEEQVRALEEWLRDLLGDLPLRRLRAELSQIIHRAAQAIDAADLDGPAREARGKLEEARQAIDDFDPSEEIREALDAVRGVIQDVLDTVTQALQAIGEAADELADGAAAIVQEVADVLAEFAAAIEEAERAIDSLEIEAAAQQVVDAIVELRIQGEELIRSADLPDALRVLIDQLVQQIGEIDLDEAIKAPVDAALRDFDILDELDLSGRIGEVQATLQNLVPREIEAAIAAEVDEVLDVIRSFKPEKLRQAIREYLDDAADAIDEIDLGPAIDVARQPFQVLLDPLDSVRPDRLLEPVIQAYEELLGGLELPSATAATQRAAQAVASVGDTLSRPLREPIAELAPEGTIEFGPPGAPPTVEGVRPGDVVRMLGYLPRKLREALAELDAGPAGEAARAIDRLSGGLARDLRRLQGELWEVERRVEAALDELIVPLAAAQARAQLALQARFEAQTPGAEVRVDLDASLVAVARVGPGPLRRELAATVDLVREGVRGAARTAGGEVGAALARAADALERCRLASVGGDLDALLDALDPEPLAAEIDALVAAAAAKVPELAEEAADELQAISRRLAQLVLDLNPGAQAQRFLRVLDILREELDVLNPRRLAEELNEIHAVMREAVAAYDPAAFGEDLQRILGEIAETVREIDPSAFLTDDDLASLEQAVDAAEEAVPSEALKDVGAALDDAGEALRQIDLAGLVAKVEEIPARVQAAFHLAIDAVERELNTLLASLRFHGEASVTVSGSATAEVGP